MSLTFKSAALTHQNCHFRACLHCILMRDAVISPLFILGVNWSTDSLDCDFAAFSEKSTSAQRCQRGGEFRLKERAHCWQSSLLGAGQLSDWLTDGVSTQTLTDAPLCWELCTYPKMLLRQDAENRLALYPHSSVRCSTCCTVWFSQNLNGQ